MGQQHFFVEGRWLGSRRIPDKRVIPGLEIRQHDSLNYYCILCGEIWGRLVHEGARLHQCTFRFCARHGDGRLSQDYIGPSYAQDYFEEDWPDGAVRHEFERFLDRIDKELR